MTQTPFSDDVLMAYADGELDDDTARDLEAALRDNAELADRLRLFTLTADRLSAEAAAHPPEPLSDDLMRRITATLDAARSPAEDVIVPFVPKRAKQAGRWQPMALAASIALVIGFGAGFGAQIVTQGNDDAQLAHGAGMSASIETALSDMLTGESREVPDGTLTVIASFLNDSNELCREFEFDRVTGETIVSVVCNGADRWETRLVVATSGRDGATYAPASSFDTLDAYLAAIGAGAPLSQEDEAAALRAVSR